LELQPRDIGDAAAGPLSKEEKVKVVIEDLLDRLPELFNMQDLMNKVNVIECLYLSKTKNDLGAKSAKSIVEVDSRQTLN